MALKQPCIFFLSLLLALTLISGCEREAPESVPDESDMPAVEDMGPVTQIDPKQEAATRTAWSQGNALLQEAIASADKLHGLLEQFLSDPSADTLHEARQGWRKAHRQWHQLDALLAMADGNPGLFSRLNRLVFRIDAHPLHPGYLDSVENYPYSGIVNDISLDIKADALRDQHGLTDESDVSLGFHALEFLLWGEKGERPADAFERVGQTTAEQKEAGLTVADLPTNRRRDLTLLISQLLRDDLVSLDAAWNGEDSWLHRNYHGLHPASRVQLLKNAAQQYLGDNAPSALTNLNSPDTAHNRFAGNNQAPLVSSLTGLNKVVTGGEPPLSEWLGESEPTQAWLEELEQLTESLQSELDIEKREETKQQLRQLSEFLVSDVTL